MPQLISLGYSFTSDKFLITGQGDALFLNHEDILINDEVELSYRIGTEVNMLNIVDTPLMLRLGLYYSGGKLQYALGCGVPFDLENKIKLEFNYALDPGIMDEGLSHLITFSVLN